MLPSKHRVHSLRAPTTATTRFPPHGKIRASTFGPLLSSSLVHKKRRAPLVISAIASTGGQEGAPGDDPARSLDELKELGDPESRLRRYGRSFGGGYRLTSDWLKDAPQVRVRRASDRKKDQIAELAVINGRLAGLDPWEVRRRVEFLKMRKRNWELIYDLVTQQEATVTLATIEECNRKVEEALSDEYRERRSLPELKTQLQRLQSEVAEAHSRMHETQARVDFHVKKLEDLRAESTQLEPAQQPEASTSMPASAAAAAAAQTAPSAPPAPPPRPARSKRADRAGLRSSMDIEPGLREFWYPVEFSANMGPGKLIPLELFGDTWVLFRGEGGQPACVRDSCAHRACPLSLGTVEEGKIVCAYHGWTFDRRGSCTSMPSTAFVRGVSVDSLPCVEADGMVWVYPGEEVPPGRLPVQVTQPPQGFETHAEVVIEVPVEHGLLVENLLDLAHAPFTHTSTFAKGWPVPETVAFKSVELLTGHWSPYPIDMSFHPPCMTLSTIGLSQPGKIERGVRQQECRNHLHQLHVCLPAARGKTRLLYRMSLDFMPWARSLPLMTTVWRRVADQVLGEDLRLVLGQQRSMEEGGDTWANPVSYDKLAVRYRRWRNSVAAGLDGEHSRDERDRPITMDAGSMFAIEEGEEGGQDGGSSGGSSGPGRPGADEGAGPGGNHLN